MLNPSADGRRRLSHGAVGWLKMGRKPDSENAAAEGVAQERREAAHHGRVPYYAKMPYYNLMPYYGAAAGDGAAGSSGADAGGVEGESLFGGISMARVLRVCAQHWITILVFATLGVIGAFFVYKLSPVVYEAKAIIEMSIRPPRILPGRGAMVEGDSFGSIEEVFNTRLARLRSRAILEQVLARYHADYPDSMVPDTEMIHILSAKSDMTLQRRSRLVILSVRSANAQLAADLANSYAFTAETFTQDENKLVSEEAVAWLRTTVEAQRRKLSEADQAILAFKEEARVDSMEMEKEGIGVALARINEEMAGIESRAMLAEEMLRALQQLKDVPDRFCSLPDNAPRAGDIMAAYGKLQILTAERDALLARYTDRHPEVQAKESQVGVCHGQFIDVVKHACETAQANYDLLKSQVEPFRARRDELSGAYADLQARIDAAVIRQHQLKRDLTVNEQSYQALLNRMEEARLAHDENMCTVKVCETSLVPSTAISPRPMLIFPAGLLAGLVAGMLLVLGIDHFEDKVTGIGDIEQRLRMKVLCVLPHVPRMARENLAVIAARDKFSHFSEAFAGLRNLLDSPRYQEQSSVMLVVSTQPGEGKTITAVNLALTYACSGQRTLLLDFDLRRPRLARIFGKKEDDFCSLPHALARNASSLFASLPVPSGFDSLDVVLARSSAEISPAVLMGTGIVGQFFDWARANYDRVIIDSPPFGIVGDAVALANLADSVLLLCCPGRTYFAPLKHAVRHLGESAARIAGVVVNDVNFMRRSTFYGYGYHFRYASDYHGRYGYGGQAAGAAMAENGASGAGAAAPQRPASGIDGGRG